MPLYKARVKNNICTNAHPMGCYQNVQRLADQAMSKPFKGPDLALVVGASSGIGLTARAALSFAGSVDTLGVYYDRAAQAHKFGTAGWYNNQGLEYIARRNGQIALSTNQDAFQSNAKDWIIQKLKYLDRPLDLLVYSVAAPRRTVKGVGDFQSVIKPVTESFSGQTVDPFTGELKQQLISPATADEVEATIKVMGGEDWQDWVDTLLSAGVLAKNFKTIAFSYLGPEQTQGIYGQGTLGKAKAHLHESCIALQQRLKKELQGTANIGLYPALITPSSAVIPSMPLYLSILHKTLKQTGNYESPLAQTLRLFADGLYGTDAALHDGQYLRVDQVERSQLVQQCIAEAYAQMNQTNLDQFADTDGFRQAFLQQFGFDLLDVDYSSRPDPLLSPAMADISTLNPCIA